MAPSLIRRSDAATPAAKDDISGTIVACSGVMIALSTLAVGLRFYVRGWMLRAIASEDWCILVAWIFTVVASGGTIKEAQVALGRHIQDVPPENFKLWFKTAYFKALFYNLSISLTKISILLLYLRVLKTYNYMRKAFWVLFGFVIIYTAVTLALYFTMCIPIQRTWDRSIEGYCHPDMVWLVLNYIHISTDFVIFLLPIPVVVTMTNPWSQKAGLLFVFCVGFFVCLLSALRAVWLKELYVKPDVTWHLTEIANWSTIEINIAVVCACLTTLKPLFLKIFGPCIAKISCSRPENGRESRPATIGSSPLQAFRGRVVHSLGRPTFMELNSLTTGTFATIKVDKASSADGEDTLGTSGITRTGQAITSKDTDKVKVALPKTA
ncbi:Phosphoglucosamine mutase [Cladorrhinum sp. PSN259]|nr:Phosphoglucosamine mutase [Cladorrhinum sp. PSN259]